MAQCFGGYKRILLPADFSDYAARTASQVAWLARCGGSTVHLAHVVVNPLDPIYQPDAVEHWVVVEHADARARALLAALAEAHLPADIARELHVLSGDPYAKLVDLAQRLEVDLIAMATHSSRHLAHRVIGGLAEKIARHAGCAVLIVRGPDASD